ncbi:MAG: hypothetical protein M1587_07205 [Thaumarchaeota archaeon]|nr:hypothetical protein [Nitrososphaerota archaeon]MCL5067476.1 hypothetical protein [Nitrososphaerota archaeon]
MKKSSRSKRSSMFVLFSIAFFAAAMLVAEYQALFVALGFVVFGGFMMLISNMMREKVQTRKIQREDELLA